MVENCDKCEKDMKTVLVINHAGMGHGDDALGLRILQTLLGKVRAFRELEAIVLYNSGVKLLAAGSPAVQPLAAIETGGVEIVACGTCVDHFGLRESIKVGRIGSMDDILALMNGAAKAVTL